MLARLRNIAGKIEGSEGVIETLAATDAKTFVYNQKVDLSPEIFSRNLEKNFFGDLAHLVGKRPGKMSFDCEVKGSGVLTTAPDWWRYVQACGASSNTLKSISIGSITNGPFLHGETITGGTSTATGKVIKVTTNGASAILVVVLTGTFQSGETITGGTSGATATTSSTATNAGMVLLPITASVPSLTLGGYQDGIRKYIKGARGSGRFKFKTGDPTLFSPEFMGVEAGVTDNSIFSGIVPESILPPVFLNATMTADGVAAKISEMDIDLGVILGMRTAPADNRGILCYSVTDRKSSGSFDPEMVLVATHDFFGKLFAGTTMELIAKWGSGTGAVLTFYAPAIQYISVGDEERDGIATAPCNFRLTSNLGIGNDDWALIQTST